MNEIPTVIERGQPELPRPGQKEIWLAAGCFWGAQKYLSGIPGGIATSVGYANGHTPRPTYQQVCARTTGYAETVHVVYDPEQLSLRFLLGLYLQSIDPTSINRQGEDVGDQYRTGIYYLDASDLPAIRASLDALAKTLERPVAVEAKRLENYYLAEEYHQEYLVKNPGGYCHISDAMCKAAAQAKEYSRPDDAALRKRLTALQYDVTQLGATEPAFENEYHNHFEPGIYVDVTTGEPLFLSTHKFESGCGWPAFARPVHPEALKQKRDTSHGMERVEVRSGIGNAHLGHVFPDGPQERGGLRYCINSAALRFVPLADMQKEGYEAFISKITDTQ